MGRMSPRKLQPDVPDVDPVDAGEVDRLLALSRASHLKKKEYAGRVDRDGNVLVKPDYPKAEACIAEALALRLKAEGLDPRHTCTAWDTDQAANNGVPSGELIEFFTRYASIP